ncbi:Protein of unknown function [Pyronema omphalodes CBS 100304]|uniref:Uncharacterized protein n=1 Tax=Pyronema omphalodes (strain CBS 100304) TaxID=1076935 RepID=U4LDJ6_PYROM|nr:Protein of unknown function [Pyronema omphalodes CBS 100304]
MRWFKEHSQFRSEILIDNNLHKHLQQAP